MAQKRTTRSDKEKVSAYQVAGDEEIEKFLTDPESFEPSNAAALFYSSLRYGDREVEINKTKKKP